MELSVEVNKYFAEEMARHIIGEISEDELNAKARVAWDNINKSDYWSTSDLQKAVNGVYLDAIKNQVEQLCGTEEYQERIKKDAEAVVDQIIQKSREKMIEEVSNRMAGLSTGYCGVDLRYYIQSVVNEMLR